MSSQAFPSVGAGDWLPFSQTLTQGWPATNTIFTTSILIQLIPQCQPFFASCPWSSSETPNRPSSGGSLQPAPRLMGDSAKGTGYAQALPRLHGSKLTWPISGDHQVVRPRQTHEDPQRSIHFIHFTGSSFQHPGVRGNNKPLRSSRIIFSTCHGRRWVGAVSVVAVMVDPWHRHSSSPWSKAVWGQVPPWWPETKATCFLKIGQKNLPKWTFQISTSHLYIFSRGKLVAVNFEGEILGGDSGTWNQFTQCYCKSLRPVSTCIMSFLFSGISAAWNCLASSLQHTIEQFWPCIHVKIQGQNMISHKSSFKCNPDISCYNRRNSKDQLYPSW